MGGSECGSGARTDALPSALDRLDEIARRLKKKRLAVFLDYDGTLTPIVETPGQAVLSPEVRETLEHLAALCFVAVISGRDLRDVRKKMGVGTIFHAGCHGFEIEGPGGVRMENARAAEFLSVLDSAGQKLRNGLGGIDGAFVERKKYSIAVHYRGVAQESRKKVAEAVHQVLVEHPGLRMSSGKKIHELQPKIDWHKGRALLWLLETLKLDRSDTLPLYIGDDITDEDAFNTLRGWGIGIVVREESRCTAAGYSLKSPGEVLAFLKAIVSLLQAESR